MSGIEFIADTNTLLYIINKYPCVQPFLDMRTGISVITEMELLSFSKITTADDIVLRNLISKCAVISLNKPIKERAILLRRKYGTKLPDSIVAATAIECELPLLLPTKASKK